MVYSVTYLSKDDFFGVDLEFMVMGTIFPLSFSSLNKY